MVEKTKLTFFKRNVNYPIGIRYFIGDVKGKTLMTEDPYVAIEEDDIRDFTRANRFLLEEGLLVVVDEPSFEGESANAITDEKAVELVKNIFILKKALVNITSPAMLQKLLDVAKQNNRSKKIIDLIVERLEDVTPLGSMPGIDAGTVSIRDGVKVYHSGSEEDLKKAVRSKT